MSETRYCTRFESIPYDATNIRKEHGPDGSINSVTGLPYLWVFEVKSSSNYPLLKVEEKLQKCKNDFHNTFLGEQYEKIDFHKLFPHRNFREFVEEFSDEWEYRYTSESVFNKYVDDFFEREYKEYCKKMDEFEKQERMELKKQQDFKNSFEGQFLELKNQREKDFQSQYIDLDAEYLSDNNEDDL